MHFIYVGNCLAVRLCWHCCQCWSRPRPYHIFWLIPRQLSWYRCNWCSDSTFVFFCDKLMVIWNVGCGVKYVLTYIVFWYCQNSNGIGYHLQWGWFWAMPLSLFNAHSLSTWSICWLGVYMYSDCLWDYADHIYQLHFYRVSHTASHVSYALLRRSWYLCIAMTRRWFSSGAYTLVVP